jgi:hypothetical protein
MTSKQVNLAAMRVKVAAHAVGWWKVVFEKTLKCRASAAVETLADTD